MKHKSPEILDSIISNNLATLRLMYRILAILILTGAAQDKPSCADFSRDFAVSEILINAMGIGTGFATEFRVERKSTNTRQLADAFLDYINSEITYLTGEKSPYERDPSNPGMTNITNTIYPFSRKLQGILSTRIRIRQYGERSLTDKTKAAFTPTLGKIVGLELKAKTNTPGVVVKPIIKVNTDWLIMLFTNRQTLLTHWNELSQNFATLNPTVEKKVFEIALKIVEEFHLMNEIVEGNSSVAATSVEYTRVGFVTEVADQTSGEKFKVQITSDRAIEMRDTVDPTKSPYENADAKVSHRYPNEGPNALVVTEMKSPVKLNNLYLNSLPYVLKNIPTYVLLRQRYEALQKMQAPGFEADSGKSKQLITSPLSIPTKDKLILLEADL